MNISKIIFYILIPIILLASFIYIKFYANNINISVSKEPVIKNEKIEEKPIDNIRIEMDKMSVEEKIGQMFLAGIYTNDSTEVLKKLIGEKKIGSVILLNPNIKGKDIRSLTNSLQSIATSSGQPILLISIDQEGGIVSRINNPLWDLTSQTKIKNYDESYGIASRRGNELRSVGINVNFSPVLDYITNPKSFLYNRVFHGTKEEISSLGIAMVKGYQDNGISATVKHFPGHDDSSVDSHKSLPVSEITEQEMPDYIEIFRKVIEESKPYMVMTSHVLFPKIDLKYPATLSPKIINILRNDLKFNGIIITDDMNMGAITSKFGTREAVKQAIIAGNDILLYVANEKIINEAYNEVLNMFNTGQISLERIDSSVYRILSLKSKLSK